LLGDFLAHGKFSGLEKNKAFLTVLAASLDRSPAVREAAVRLFQVRSDSHNPLPDVADDLLRRWADDPNEAVRFHLAYCLGQGDYNRMTEALAEILRKGAGNRWTRAVVLSGLHDRFNAFAEKWFGTGSTELPDKPSEPLGFNDSPAMVELARDMGRVYGAHYHEAGPAIWRHALAEKALGSAWQSALLAGASVGIRESGSIPFEKAPLLAAAAQLEKGTETKNASAELGKIAAKAGEIAANETAEPIRRSAALQLLAELPTGDTLRTMVQLMQPSQPKDIQIAAARGVAQNLEPRLAKQISSKETWSALMPASRELLLNALASKRDLAPILVSAIESGSIPAWNLNPNRKRAVLEKLQGEARTRAEALFGTTGGEDRLKALEENKRVLQLPASGRNGEAVFMRVCGACHQHGGKGAGVGPDLTGVKNQPVEALLYHILVPDAEIYPGYQNYEVETKDGVSHSGLLAEENESFITLKRALDETEQIPRNRISSMRATASSLMPNELEKTMTPQELADLIAFLKGSAK
jgi:putative heme-binding domain-containing protein